MAAVVVPPSAIVVVIVPPPASVHAHAHVTRVAVHVMHVVGQAHP